MHLFLHKDSKVLKPMTNAFIFSHIITDSFVSKTPKGETLILEQQIRPIRFNKCVALPSEMRRLSL